MNTNSTYQIGNEHIICQDYALSGIYDDTAYAIVCDGCSNSKDTDIGSRMLALAAREALLSGYTNEPLRYGNEIINKANQLFNFFPHINNQTLDATLLMAWVEENMLNVFLSGDGVLIHRSKYKVDFKHISYETNAPAYLSYNLDIKRKTEYNTVFF
eukprot:TRINITY_DN23496_c0_g1_i2.p1 TRINITY_DN23496_c0_g1~~TRINITY_DN23496_c0_g1_i2.p1  ORF type:complete len:157 (-),score=7.03 TRINITY_DN23496_c0_g1_i2:404-874(-)